MAPTQKKREEELRELLTDAVEVQLAAFKVGIDFWSKWVEEASEFVKSATNTLRQIQSEGHEPKDALLEVVDAGRASIRSMTELPRHTAARFIEALDALEEKKEPASRRSRARSPGTQKAKKASRSKRAAKQKGHSRPKRAGRVKA